MKVLLTATVQSHICQFHKPLVEMLYEHGCEVHVAARDNLAEKNGLKLDFVDKVFDVPFARSPKSPDNIKAYKQLKKIIDEGHYDVIHCNTPMGGIVTRLAARKARKEGTKVYYTAHGFHFYKGAPKKNWIIYYPIERYMARYCDTLITITKEDYEFAKIKFGNVNVEHIHGVGVSKERYHPIGTEERVQIRKAEGISDSAFTILCTGELNENKDQSTLISAAAKLKIQIPNLLLLFAGNGPLEGVLRQQIESYSLGNMVRLLGYRTDLEKIVPAMDLIVSCSHREGLPLNIIEAMLCEKPVVASINRGHSELIENDVNGYLFRKGDSDSLAKYIKKLYEDLLLCDRLGVNGKEIAHNYTSNAVKGELEGIIIKGINDGNEKYQT